ncbi:putative aldouronate transport system permease protein [Cohnella sp. OV330]|uniref:carbohydrate ABC transporter permease n=1 Tax=Cohnella sp. OV330 TaxID=1855288 RepID=UPI0008E687AF|nr:carbohydrate ABC transporter permease [Cohnella sp. OV330]SFA81910.1 putative aldouronate transport system permease protein [Cohnella sp. OV330]
MHHISPARRAFLVLNAAFLSLLAILCFLPLIHVLAVSFSESAAVAAGQVTFWPVDFTLKSYDFIISRPEFMRSFVITLERVLLGTAINMLLTIMIAYPLSKDVRTFRMRTFYVWIFVFTILFAGGLVPWYMTIKYTGLLDSVWALVIPGAVPVFNVILLLNFFRGLPKELEESCFIDGAGHLRTLWTIYVPLSLPGLATVGLFTIVGHWNAWFDGLILMNKPEHYPLSSYLQTIIINFDFSHVKQEDLYKLSAISTRTSKAAQIIVGALPILLAYPFLQKYFVKGIVLGSVKE